MSIYFSKSTSMFYDSTINTIPSDGIKVSNDDYKTLIAARESGQVITVDSSGNVIAQAAPALSTDDAHKQLVIQARNALTVSDTNILRALESGLEINDAWKSYRQALRDIINGTSSATTLPTVPTYQV